LNTTDINTIGQGIVSIICSWLYGIFWLIIGYLIIKNTIKGITNQSLILFMFFIWIFITLLLRSIFFLGGILFCFNSITFNLFESIPSYIFSIGINFLNFNIWN